MLNISLEEKGPQGPNTFRGHRVQPGVPAMQSLATSVTEGRKKHFQEGRQDRERASRTRDRPAGQRMGQQDRRWASRTGDGPAGQGMGQQVRGQASRTGDGPAGHLKPGSASRGARREQGITQLPPSPLCAPTHPPGKVMIGRSSWGGCCRSGPPCCPDRCFNLLFEERLLHSSAVQTSVSV